MWESNQAFAADLFWHIKHVIDLHDTVVRIQSLQTREIWQDVRAPANVTFAWAKFEFTSRGAIHFIVFGNVVDAVVRPAAKLPHIVGDFNRETVV